MQSNKNETIGLNGSSSLAKAQGLFSHLRYTILPYLYIPFTFLRRVLFSKNGDDYNKILFFNRWGFVSNGLVEKVSAKKTVWIDALSGGEITQIVTFCKLLKDNLSDYNIILSTNNEYSMKFAKKYLKEIDYIFDSPWDIRWVAKRLLKKIKPSLVIFVEGAYLPILVQEARKMKIKTMLVSGLMREKWLLHNHYFYRRYFFLNPFKDVDYILAKSRIDYDCLIRLGIEPKKIRTMGNLKFDTKFLSISSDEVCQLKNALNITDEEIVLVAGSIHPKEEDLIIEAYHRLRQNNINIRLIIAPRYNHFIPRIIKILQSYKYPYILRSNIGHEKPSPDKIVIVDTFGELMHFYGLSSIIVVGGSFICRNPCGFGQNIVEPLLHFKPIFFGPYMEQFKEITSRLLSIWDGMEIHSAEELSRNIMHLLNDRSLCQDIISDVRRIVEENNQSITKHIEFIKNEVARN